MVAAQVTYKTINFWIVRHQFFVAVCLVLNEGSDVIF